MMGKITLQRLMLLFVVSVSFNQQLLAEEEEQSQSNQIPERLTNIPFSDIASVLNDDTVAAILNFLKLGVIVDPAKGIAKLFYALEQFEKDIRTAQATAPQLRVMATCAQYPKVWRTDPVKSVISNRGKVVGTCAQVGCDGSRAECLKKAIGALKTILKPFIQGTIVGYQQGDKHIDGIAYILMDIVQQSSTKGELAIIADPLQKVMRVLDMLEKNIKSKGAK